MATVQVAHSLGLDTGRGRKVERECMYAGASRGGRSFERSPKLTNHTASVITLSTSECLELERSQGRRSWRFESLRRDQELCAVLGSPLATSWGKRDKRRVDHRAKIVAHLLTS